GGSVGFARHDPALWPGRLLRGRRRRRDCVRFPWRDPRAGAPGTGIRRCPHPAVSRIRRALAAGADALAQDTGPPMTRTHRQLHRLIWSALFVAVGVGLTTALLLRAPLPAPEPAAQAHENTK